MITDCMADISISMDIVSVVLFIVTVLIVMLFLYIATRLVTREEVVTASYALRLFITAAMAVVIVPLLAGLLTDAVIGILVAFLALMITVRFLIISEASLGDEWLESFIVTFLIILFVYIFNLVLVKVLGISPFIDIGV
ncbi:MAG: hypothetical protein KAS60_02240 [Thermoplasmata archaeon]|nr:hypothetical protein [Candidatus Thermoplasmatota archaeon]MCK4948899.1 hypothetical protein [Thermoplasmata archaeon]